MEKISRGTFVRLAAALGVGAASASLAACGGGSGGSSGGGSGGNAGDGGGNDGASGGTSTDRAQGQTSSGGAAIARESEVAPGDSVKFEEGGQDAVLVHLDSGDFVAYSAVCTHAGCIVAYRDAQLVCPCHGSIFDPANGAKVVSGPARTPLPEIPIEIQNGEILRA